MPIPLIAAAPAMFAAAAEGGEILIAAIGGIAALGKAYMERQTATTLARYALGTAIAPWIGSALLIGTVGYFGYKILKGTDADEMKFSLNGKEMSADAYIKKGKTDPMSVEKFNKAADDQDVINEFKKYFEKFRSENKLTKSEARESMTQSFLVDPNYSKIPKQSVVDFVSKISQ